MERDHLVPVTEDPDVGSQAGPTEATGAPAEPARHDAPPGRLRLAWSPVWFVLGALLLVTVTVAGGASLVGAPYVVYAPGSAFETAPAISTPGTRSYDDDGEVLFLTVSLRGASQRVGFGAAVLGWVLGDQDVFPRKAVLGDQSGEESRQVSLQMMSASQDVAAKVALEHLGYEVASRGTGAVVAATFPGTAAASVLAPGDVIVGADGADVGLDSELRAALGDHAVGDEVELRVERAGEGDPQVVRTQLIADPEGGEGPLLGITAFTRDLVYDLPFPVTIDTEDVGGPSAGLALTLGILDHLTPGSLSGGQVVATTGTMDPEGRVGEVGGVAQKAAAASRADARLLLVPSAEAADARRLASGDVEVVGVDTLDDALAALADIGGNALDLERDGGS